MLGDLALASVDGALGFASALCHAHLPVDEAACTLSHQNSPPDCFAAPEAVGLYNGSCRSAEKNSPAVGLSDFVLQTHALKWAKFTPLMDKLVFKCNLDSKDRVFAHFSALAVKVDLGAAVVALN